MLLPTQTWKDPLREVHCGVAGPLYCPKGGVDTKMPADRDYPALKCGEMDSVTFLWWQRWQILKLPCGVFATYFMGFCGLEYSINHYAPFRVTLYASFTRPDSSCTRKRSMQRLVSPGQTSLAPKDKSISHLAHPCRFPSSDMCVGLGPRWSKVWKCLMTATLCKCRRGQFQNPLASRRLNSGAAMVLKPVYVFLAHVQSVVLIGVGLKQKS